MEQRAPGKHQLCKHFSQLLFSLSICPCVGEEKDEKQMTLQSLIFFYRRSWLGGEKKKKAHPDDIERIILGVTRGGGGGLGGGLEFKGKNEGWDGDGKPG